MLFLLYSLPSPSQLTPETSTAMQSRYIHETLNHPEYMPRVEITG